MKKGELIIMPTDTVYGLCAMLYDQEALEKIYVLKGREQSKQIPILLSSIGEAKEIAIVSKEAEFIMERYWPGKLTIVLKATDLYKDKTSENTVALRIPNHPVALNLLKKYGPMRATSVNLSGQKPLTEIYEIKRAFGHSVKEIYEQHQKTSNVSSTVIDLTSKMHVLREGAITLRELEALLSQIQ